MVRASRATEHRMGKLTLSQQCARGYAFAYAITIFAPKNVD